MAQITTIHGRGERLAYMIQDQPNFGEAKALAVEEMRRCYEEVAQLVEAMKDEVSVSLLAKVIRGLKEE